MRILPLLLRASCAASLLISPAVLGAQVAQTKPDSVGRVATEPLRDVRIQKDKIPEILQLAASAPYSMYGMTNCARIGAEVGRLNAALGDDVDLPAKKKGEGSEIAAAGARAAVNTLIPGLGIVKVITGADRAQRRAEAAVYAGSVRRAFLKGIGLSKGCRAPAAPTHAAIIDRPEIADDRDDK